MAKAKGKAKDKGGDPAGAPTSSPAASSATPAAASSSATAPATKLRATSMRQFGRVVTVDVERVLRGAPEKGEALDLVLVDGHKLTECPKRAELKGGETHHSLPCWHEEPIVTTGRTASFDDAADKIDDDELDGDDPADLDDDAGDAGDAARGDATHPPVA